MKIVVLKFGGTSVGTIDRISRAAEIIINYISSIKTYIINKKKI